MRALLAITISFLLLAPAAAEDSKPAEQMLTLTSRSELVLVPTLVRDKSGSHITGLSQSDFALLENGSERKIAVFEEIKTSAVRPRRQTLPAGEVSNYLVNEPAPRRVTIIVMDSINTQFADWAYARDQLLKFLEETAGSNEPMALLQLRRGGVRVIHDFTTDPAVLAKAVWRLKSGHKPPPDLAEDVPDAIVAAESQQLASMMQDIQQNYLPTQRVLAATVTLDGMQAIARAYAAIPGRKSLIWASGGFPFSMDDLTRGMPSHLGDVLPVYERTWQRLNDANIALYPVDVRGLVVPGPSASTSGARSARSSMQRAAWMHQDTLATFDAFANMTGGKAYFNTSDLVHAFHDAVDDSASYYMLGFYLAPDDRQPGWRKLQVKVKQPHAHLRSRSGFYVMPEDKDKNKTRLADIELAMSSPLDLTSLPILVRWRETTPNGEKKRTAFEIFLPANAATVDESSENHMSLDFAAAAREPAGKIVASHGRTVEAHLKPESLAEIRSGGITYKGNLELPSGEYTVRFVVRDNLNGRLGSVAAPLSIP